MAGDAGLTAMRDRGLHALVAANVLTVAVALWQDWPLLTMLWPYWCQSVVVGWYSRRRILALPEAGPASLPPTLRSPRRMADVFALHYGGFHLLYLLFLLAFTGFAVVGQVAPRLLAGPGAPAIGGELHWYDPLLVVALGYGFWSAQRAAFPARLAADGARPPGIVELMARPYLRVLPMHLTLLFALPLSGAWAIVLFGSLKTLVDVGMHLLERRDLARLPAPVARAAASGP